MSVTASAALRFNSCLLRVQRPQVCGSESPQYGGSQRGLLLQRETLRRPKLMRGNFKRASDMPRTSTGGLHNFRGSVSLRLGLVGGYLEEEPATPGNL